MCVKEFYGFNCGHCSTPILRKCPLTTSNEHFPPCKLPAERPIYTNENCHPCSRVLWNAKVLKEEEEHRERHDRGECRCEVVFKTVDRTSISSYSNLPQEIVTGNMKLKATTVDDITLSEHNAGFKQDEHSQGSFISEDGTRVRWYKSRPRSEKNKGKGKENAWVEDRRNHCTGVASATGPSGQPGQPGQPGQQALFRGTRYATMHMPYSPMQYRFVGGSPGPRDHLMPVLQGPSEPPLSSYFAPRPFDDNSRAQGSDWFGFHENGYIPQSLLSTSQLIIGQPNAGMRWYSQPQSPTKPTYRPRSSSTGAFEVDTILDWQRTSWMPPLVGKIEKAVFEETECPPEENVPEQHLRSPIVVSSDMIGSNVIDGSVQAKVRD